MSALSIVFPHHLFFESPLLSPARPVYLVEEFLFFRQYAFHQQKIALHRASMKAYADYLEEQGLTVHYIAATDPLSDIRQLIPQLAQEGYRTLHYFDPVDNWLAKRLRDGAQVNGMETVVLPSPLFLNTAEELSEFFRPTKKKFYQTQFYIEERKKRNILLDEDQNPIGGKWTFDTENRKKYPRKKTPPFVDRPSVNPYYTEAREYVARHFGDNPGQLDEQAYYPIDHSSAATWLRQFLAARFEEFGPYEDAIVAQESFLHHGVLTPMLNIGLLTPAQILEQSLAYAEQQGIELNSVEGFVRQIMGWREFIRGVYQVKGTEERTRNFWGFERKIPATFYTGTTGILPVDLTIQKLLKTAYNHHIERLMVLGNFMLLCEFDPDEVYRWFMELYIDAYDWVMVPNVYGMSQFADGGLMSTKPYISGSNYLMKMSDYPKGDWQEVWDALFWRFMHVHRDFFLSNPRLGMLVRTFDKMAPEKQQHLLSRADQYLQALDDAIPST